VLVLLLLHGLQLLLAQAVPAVVERGSDAL
jgi:hypothetical protein